ncbi:MAG: histidine kinase dimerization/phospho-acceptor domain-containing protein, partial [Nitrospirota bacterium]
MDRLHPLNQQLVNAINAKSIIAVPLKVKDRIIGSLTVDRTQEHCLTQDDLDLVVTMANQVAIALDNTEAYRQIEALNLGLEARVRERTAQMEAANEQLQQMDRLKSQFLAHVSHELRTPLTSIKGFSENMLEEVAGPLSEKQKQYLTRIKENGTRLARMITALLDRSRIEAGKLELLLEEVALVALASEVVEQLRPLALGKRQRLQFECREKDLTVWADADRV